MISVHKTRRAHIPSVAAGGHPQAAYRRRGVVSDRQRESYGSPEDWHEPIGRDKVRYVVQQAGTGYIHPVTSQEIAARLALLPSAYTRGLEVVQLSRMTRKRHVFPLYGMQWGPAIYLYPIESSLVEQYVRPPTPQQVIEARMYGGEWSQAGKIYLLTWTAESIRDFYLNNVLIHEVGHLNDPRNTRFEDREKYANWFAIEHGYRASRGRIAATSRR